MKITLLLSTILILSNCTLEGEERAVRSHTSLNMVKATFAGGCFWCIEAVFDKTPGVITAVSGYTGGEKITPTYYEVSSGLTKHIESVLVTYDPARISYSQLLNIFWQQIDPTDEGGSFVDRGHQYTSAIYYHNEHQKELAIASKEYIENSGYFNREIVTKIVESSIFYPAEQYHQNFHKTNPDHYNNYRVNSGRDDFIFQIWRKNPLHLSLALKPHLTKLKDRELRKKLNARQYEVTQNDGTEPPFSNEYWDHKESGIYVDIVSNEPLFSSTHKFDSGTGWPSFTRPIDMEFVVEKPDSTFGMVRTEIRSKHGDSHLGHLFNDGPPPTGLRYCINSAALRFISADSLDEAGYSQYKELFRNY